MWGNRKFLSKNCTLEKVRQFTRWSVCFCVFWRLWAFLWYVCCAFQVDNIVKTCDIFIKLCFTPFFSLIFRENVPMRVSSAKRKWLSFLTNFDRYGWHRFVFCNKQNIRCTLCHESNHFQTDFYFWIFNSKCIYRKCWFQHKFSCVTQLFGNVYFYHIYNRKENRGLRQCKMLWFPWF